jgi:hypothetical protein
MEPGWDDAAGLDLGLASGAGPDLGRAGQSRARSGQLGRIWA